MRLEFPKRAAWWNLAAAVVWTNRKKGERSWGSFQVSRYFKLTTYITLYLPADKITRVRCFRIVARVEPYHLQLCCCWKKNPPLPTLSTIDLYCAHPASTRRIPVPLSTSSFLLGHHHLLVSFCLWWFLFLWTNRERRKRRRWWCAKREDITTSTSLNDLMWIFWTAQK